MARPPARPGTTVAVVGGGIAGLAAAWELSGGGAGTGTLRVVVLEASGRLGGKLRVEQFGTGPVDVGPDGFLGRRPEAADLCREAGLSDDLEPVGTSGAAVWVGGGRRTLPGSLAMGVPTRFLPTARSRVLGTRGALRLLVDVVWPRRDLRGPLGDRAIGPLLAHKLGRRVVDRLVDPLVGGIYAGGVDDMSAAAVYPLLLAVAQRPGGLMRSLRRAAAVGRATGSTAGAPEAGTADEAENPPAFWSLRGGLGSLGDRLGAALTTRGVEVRTGCPVERLDRDDGAGWVLFTEDGPVQADGVVLAVPAGPAADLLSPHDAEAATLLRGIDHSSVAVVTLSYAEGAVPRDLVGTGLLVPHGSPTPPSLGLDGPFLVTACTYLTAKWPHLARPGERLLRASAGRFGDDRPAALADAELVARVVAELGALLGIEGGPTAAMVTRWPHALPQYRVHHLLRVTGIEAAVKRLGGLAVAGAAYRGVGIPACVASGRAAARAVLAGEGAGRPAP